jgi:hypothetical protein
MPTLPASVRGRLLAALVGAAGRFVEVLAADVLKAAAVAPDHPTTARLKALAGSTESCGPTLNLAPEDVQHLLNHLPEDDLVAAG